MDMNSVISTFNVWANTYDDDILTASWGFESYNEGLDWICRQIMNKCPDRVIDLGCGTGALAERLKHTHPHLEYVGVDICPNMLNAAKKRIPSSLFIQADIRDYSMWINYLNSGLNCAIVSTYALHHIEDDEKIKLLRYIFSNVYQNDFFIAVVDYAFFNATERIKAINEQDKLHNFHITREIESEHYADLNYLKTILSNSAIYCSYEKNGIWDWRYVIQR